MTDIWTLSFYAFEVAATLAISAVSAWYFKLMRDSGTIETLQTMARERSRRRSLPAETYKEFELK